VNNILVPEIDFDHFDLDHFDQKMDLSKFGDTN
jgi:hypothetical protein